VYSVAVRMPMLNALSMIPASFLSTSSEVQARRWLFCAISKPETATPPQLDAFPGPYQTPNVRFA